MVTSRSITTLIDGRLPLLRPPRLCSGFDSIVSRCPRRCFFADLTNGRHRCHADCTVALVSVLAIWLRNSAVAAAVWTCESRFRQ